jgi:FMN phosphatase YigB (HAD superfamily)
MSDAVDALVFDLDGTLCEYARSGRVVLQRAFQTVDVEPFFSPSEYYASYESYVPESESIREVRERCFADLAAEAGHDPAVGRAVADAYAAERDHSSVQWVPGAESALETLGEDYPLAMVTNGDPDMQGTKLATLGIEDRFETIVHAGFEAPAKPDPAPFDMALEPLEVTPGRALTVGNSLEHDVAGAHNAGLRSAWIDHDGVAAPEPEPHYRLDSMHDLRADLWR